MKKKAHLSHHVIIFQSFYQDGCYSFVVASLIRHPYSACRFSQESYLQFAFTYQKIMVHRYVDYCCSTFTASPPLCVLHLVSLTFKLLGHEVHGKDLVHAAQPAGVDLAVVDGAGLKELLEDHTIVTHLARRYSDAKWPQRLGMERPHRFRDNEKRRLSAIITTNTNLQGVGKG